MVINVVKLHENSRESANVNTKSCLLSEALLAKCDERDGMSHWNKMVNM